jgi:hypothetical protein
VRFSTVPLLACIALILGLAGLPRPVRAGSRYLAEEGAHAIVEYPGGYRSLALSTLKITDRQIEELGKKLGLRLNRKIRVSLFPGEISFGEGIYRWIGQRPEPWVLAVAFKGPHRIAIKAASLRELSNASLRVTVKHELSHIFMGELEKRSGPVPRWFDEGVAMWASDRKLERKEEIRLKGFARHGGLIPLQELMYTFPPHSREVTLAYLESHSFVLFLEQQVGEGTIPRILSHLKEGRPFDEAFQRATGLSWRTAEARWRDGLASRYSFLEALLSRLSLFTILSLLVIVAFLRRWYKNRLLKRQMEREEEQFE